MMEVAASSSTGASTVLEAVRLHLESGGSRVRARFCLNASCQLGIGDQDAVNLAAVCELLHNASLVHDDLLDRSPTRRECASIWAAFDDTVAVCAGDLMLASAFVTIADISQTSLLPGLLRLIQQRTQQVILGQALENSVQPRTLEKYELLAIAKSASLLSLPFELPLLMSHKGAYAERLQRATSAFAVAYQMADDLQDHEQDLLSGSLNAVSVAFLANRTSLPDSRVTVCLRAAELLHLSIQTAVHLPCNCAAALIAYARTMLGSLIRQSETNSIRSGR